MKANAPEALFAGTPVFLDEPQVVLLERNPDSKIIGVAIDKEGLKYPFLGAEISFAQWQRYRRQYVDLRYLFLMPRWKRWYIFDLASVQYDKRVTLTRAQKEDYKNEHYLPSHGFFARSHTEPFEVGAGACQIGQA